MVPKLIQGGFITYTYIFNLTWRFSTTGGISYIDDFEFESPTTFKTSRYFAANFFYYPIETINLGIEYTTGRRTNIDDKFGSATRISMIGIFSF